MLINFDYDGVLVDSFTRLLGFAQHAAREIGSPTIPTSSTFRTIENLTFPALARVIGLTPEQESPFSDRIFDLQQASVDLPAMFPGIPELIRQLARNHTLAIVTASNGKEVSRTLESNDISRCITLLLDGSCPGEKSVKIKHACSITKTPPDQGWMIGDTVSDIRNGHLAGVRTIAVGWGYQSLEFMRRASPHFEATNATDIRNIIDCAGPKGNS